MLRLATSEKPDQLPCRLLYFPVAGSSLQKFVEHSGSLADLGQSEGRCRAGKSVRQGLEAVPVLLCNGLAQRIPILHRPPGKAGAKIVQSGQLIRR